MDFKGLRDDLTSSGDAERAVGMKAYMRDKFPFLGVQTPLRKELCQEYFAAAKNEKTVDWNFISLCWQEPCREFQYVAVGYLALMREFLTPGDIPKIKELAVTKSWWDTIDGLDRIIGNIALVYPGVNHILLEWSVDENFWLRRIAIDHQLTRKDKTDTELMEKIIVNNLGQTEFFINKAIGWSLRDYSKTNPGWVRDFVERYREGLSSLSIKEASKYI